MACWQSVLPLGITRLRLDASEQLCGPRRPAPPLLLHLLPPQLLALRRVSVTWPGLQPQAAALAATLDRLPALEHLALSQVNLRQCNSEAQALETSPVACQ